MGDESFRKSTRQLALPGISDDHAHSYTYLQTAIDNLNHLIRESEEQIHHEQQVLANEEKTQLYHIQDLHSEIDQVQTTINSLKNKFEYLTSKTCQMLVRQSETALIRHNKLLKESIEHINHVLRKQSIANDPVFEQLKSDMTNHQEKLYFIRNQMDIDHNKLTTQISQLQECQEQCHQLEHVKLNKQSELQRIQQVRTDYVDKQLRLQKLQLSIEQQTRVRNEVAQLGQYFESNKHHRRDQLSEVEEIGHESKSSHRKLGDIDDKIIDGTTHRQCDHANNHSFIQSKAYRHE